MRRPHQEDLDSTQCQWFNLYTHTLSHTHTPSLSHTHIYIYFTVIVASEAVVFNPRARVTREYAAPTSSAPALQQTGEAALLLKVTTAVLPSAATAMVQPGGAFASLTVFVVTVTFALLPIPPTVLAPAKQLADVLTLCAQTPGVGVGPACAMDHFCSSFRGVEHGTTFTSALLFPSSLASKHLSVPRTRTDPSSPMLQAVVAALLLHLPKTMVLVGPALLVTTQSFEFESTSSPEAAL